jgi:hypothetical protein
VIRRCADASNTYRRFAHGLGMQLVAKTDQSTGNHTFASYVVRYVLLVPLKRVASYTRSDYYLLYLSTVGPLKRGRAGIDYKLGLNDSSKT